ncbi:MAG: hypothetical protein ACKOEJ_07120, partial [Acidimicrobiaceae bacterium]
DVCRNGGTKRTAGETETHFEHTSEIATVAELLPNQSPIRIMFFEPLPKILRWARLNSSNEPQDLGS